MTEQAGFARCGRNPVEYRSRPKLQPLVAEISWSKNLVILSRCKDDLEREFYLRATARFGWTKAVLQHQIDNQSYQKYLLNQTSFDRTLPAEIQAQAALAVKDHYTFDRHDHLPQQEEDRGRIRLWNRSKSISAFWPTASTFTVAWGCAPGTEGATVVWPKVIFTLHCGW